MTTSARDRARHAAEEVGLLLFLMVIHKLLDLALLWFFPEFARTIHVVRVLVFIAFVFGYVTQAVDILFAVAPWTSGILQKGAAAFGRWLLSRFSPKPGANDATPR